MSDQVYCPRIIVEVDKWDWALGKKTAKIDITNQVLRYNFQKTIKNPSGQATVVCTPIINGDNGMNVIDTMDVVRIKEYGVTKFLGIVMDVNYLVSTSQDGKISASLSISIEGLGSILESAAIGMQLGTLLGKFDALSAAMAELIVSLDDVLKGRPTYGKLIAAIIDNFFGVVDKLGATGYRAFFDTYFDFSTCVNNSDSPVMPKTYRLYNGTDETVTLWNTILQLVESPLMEMWCDVGKRDVSIDGRTVQCGDGKMYLVFRNTPFDGTTMAGKNAKAFTDLPESRVTIHQTINFNLVKSAREAYSTFTAIPAAFDFGSFLRQLLGNTVYNQSNLNKYLYKPMNLNLFFTRKENPDSNKDNITDAEITNTTKTVSTTLKNWFEKNDQYLGGTIKMIVPRENPINIGTKVVVDAIQGYFYCEGVTHNFTYNGGLLADLILTRGVTKDGNKIVLKNKIFLTGSSSADAVRKLLI